LRYDSRRPRQSTVLDEAKTADRIAQTGMRLPVWHTTRRRRLDLDLVLDMGGSGVLWTRLAGKLRTLLESHGAFRSVRPWTLDSDRAVPAGGRARAPALLAGLPGDAGRAGTRYPPGTVCQPPRRPVVMVVTDGAGKGWWSGAIQPALREWGRSGNVLLVNLLPPRMWGGTALRPVPVTFLPTDDGYHRGTRIRTGDAELQVAGLGPSTLPAATAIPVAALDAAWLRVWAPLLRGSQSGEVEAYALLVPGTDASATDEHPGGRPWRPGPDQRMQRFLLMASDDAFRLVWYLSSAEFTLAEMRRVQEKLVPESGPSALAEVLLGGLVHRRSPGDDRIRPDDVIFDLFPDVRKLLREFGDPDPVRGLDPASVAKVLTSGVGSGQWVDAPAAQPLGEQATTMPPSAPVLRTRPARRLVPVRRPERPVTPAVPEAGPLHTRPVRVGLWGANLSGKTTYLTALTRADWQVRRSGVWRVTAADSATRRLMSTYIEDLDRDGRFPDTTLTPAHLSFQLLYEPRQRRWPWRLLSAARAAEIGLTFTDRPGGDFLGHLGNPGSGQDSPVALATLEHADALVYFFDPTYDMDDEQPLHSLSFFDETIVALSRAMAQQGRLHGRFLPQHIAVYITKLDDRRVYRAARRHGCVQADPRTGLPWVPDRDAQQLFEGLCRDRMTAEADYLLNEVPQRFDPRRISFHAISSVGFRVGDDGTVDPDDPSKAKLAPASGGAFDPAGRPPQWRVRGQIQPVNVLEPLVALVRNASRTLR
jgi:hypothetical protein